jgi:hypothetical protein
MTSARSKIHCLRYCLLFRSGRFSLELELPRIVRTTPTSERGDHARRGGRPAPTPLRGDARQQGPVGDGRAVWRHLHRRPRQIRRHRERSLPATEHAQVRRDAGRHRHESTARPPTWRSGTPRMSPSSTWRRARFSCTSSSASAWGITLSRDGEGGTVMGKLRGPGSCDWLKCLFRLIS